jgi:hypothetical protein
MPTDDESGSGIELPIDKAYYLSFFDLPLADFFALRLAPAPLRVFSVRVGALFFARFVFFFTPTI